MISRQGLRPKSLLGAGWTFQPGLRDLTSSLCLAVLQYEWMGLKSLCLTNSIRTTQALRMCHLFSERGTFSVYSTSKKSRPFLQKYKKSFAEKNTCTVHRVHRVKCPTFKSHQTSSCELSLELSAHRALPHRTLPWASPTVVSHLVPVCVMGAAGWVWWVFKMPCFF